ncbi:hypothetical protein CcaverHIS002_0602810 [Cutaneotrichosporon cavernicola]|uniref:Pentacotripeptide-repeat region of PRORP domain-containing protein n=1 Tax=Cutaneotrichosporon cavernicola TaxID=279322 RepID=A0AA48L8B7_9TREE|nr:uncharacterized protein CcaverHIS019_0602290 [Cutaneotrichosporon cavernicola]BEI85994.1 hypothetical protein CcaverHIS002_0602810 [Cutaneotrichosporon cavernicola]BEI93770.1 hypothetical protein CcaverHIS019_0602290 [Cutaneotrichosporon cavernicola]BEJ01548.1 hypothetical protein CcaverHIS631_0602300 [Cutaneotrichosporon cavernicola]BEJ09312.1 hypothetical protein CcaverHIS641_0602270 [Cutaneotrichosporon cavernicola]
MPMLSKAATTFRPFLRFQTQHQPELFSSNPNLLHHFNSGHGIVQGAAQTAAGSGGAAGGAGRAYGGASGGYTGHARAFLTLPGSNGDIAGVNTSAEEREKRKARQSAGMALKRGAKVPEPTLPRTVMMKDRMAPRAGGHAVAMVEMKEEDAERASITYPAWAALPSDASPGGALWAPGSAPRRIGARAFSTSVQRIEDDEIPVPLISATGPQHLEQPNRVLQDLAGLDLGRPGRVSQRRRNSTASVVRSETEEIPGYVAPAEAEVSPDAKIYNAISQLGRSDPELVHRIIDYYRQPRNSASIKGQPDLEENYPLPAGYTVATYNVIIRFLLRQRERGASIAPILDIYNEMLARDVVPNLRTTTFVIHALCVREEDVSAASHRWLNEMESQKLRQQAGVPVATEADKNAAEVIDGYQHEQNFASALNLYRVSSTFFKNSRVPRNVNTLDDLLAAAASSIGLPHAPTPESIEFLLNELDKVATQPLDGVAAAFQLLAAKKDLDAIKSLWERVLAGRPDLSSNSTYGTPALVTQIEAAKAFVAAGDKAKALEIANTDGQGRTLISYRVVSALAEAGDIDEAVKLLREVGNESQRSDSATIDVAEALIAAGRVKEGVEYAAELRRAALVSGKKVDARRMRNMYARVLAAAIKNPEDSELMKSIADAAANCAPWPPIELVARHIQLLVDTRRYADINPLLLVGGPLNEQKARTLDFDRTLLREAYADVVASEASIPVVLQAIRGFARLGEPLADANDSIPLPITVVDKYVKSRAGVQNVGELGIQLDGWYRLLQAFEAIPTSHIDAGAADAALGTFMADLAEAQKSGGLKLPNTMFTTTSIQQLVDILMARLGVEHASELVTNAFGERATHLLPTPEHTPAASESEFTLPPTPDSAQSPPGMLQPVSKHTLHISSKLDGLIDRLHVAMPPVTPVQVYETLRESISRDNTVPAPDVIGRLIAQLARAGEEAKARELYQLAQVVLASCLPDPQQQAAGWRAVEDSMIAACCFLGQLEQAGMHRARIIEAGMAPSADAYATMIASSRDSTDDALVARELFDESQSLGVVPHLYLFNTIISKLSKARKAEMALDLFQHMKAAGIRPSSVTYGAVINACCRVGDAESAEMLFDEMVKQPNFKPRVPPFNTMMQFHLQTRPSRARVLHYYDSMRSAGVRPSAHTYKLLLDAYGTLPPIDLTAMNRVFADLNADRKVPVQGTHWASIIMAYGVHGGDVPKAVSMFDSIGSHPSANGAVPEPVVWEAILNVLGQKGTLEELEAMRTRMVTSRIRPTAYVCNVLISGYAKHGQIDRARDVFESMADSVTGVAAPNNHPALLTSSGHVKPASTTQHTDKVYREPSTYEAMVRAELLAGERGRAEAVLARMEERRYPVAVWMKARAIMDEQI